MVLMLASSQIPPGSPVIDGPQVIVLNSQITLTCTSSRGDPPPSVKWFFDDSEITTGISTTTAGTAVTTSLTFTATKNYHLEFLECQAENGVLQNPLSNTIYIEVHSTICPRWSHVGYRKGTLCHCTAVCCATVIRQLLVLCGYLSGFHVMECAYYSRVTVVRLSSIGRLSVKALETG
ncbi:Hypothetical predicted protein [Mytilus galloprovincialis]|nr:Hypothetical predicted protein [Mytilus galloprovincialis]